MVFVTFQQHGNRRLSCLTQTGLAIHDLERACAEGGCGTFSGRGYCFSAHATRPYTEAQYAAGDYLLFGGESHGLPAGVVERHRERALGIRMPGGKVRSLNLATAVGIVLYEALRQLRAW